MNITTSQKDRYYTYRIAELGALIDGWKGAGSFAITKLAFNNATLFLERRTELEFNGLYFIYPTELGGLLFEFITSVNGWDSSIEFKPDGLIEFMGIETANTDDDYICTTYSAVHDASIADLNIRIKKCMGVLT